jgi:hypothetical protein
MHYSIRSAADPQAAALLASVLESLACDEQMRADRAKLNRVCCMPQELVVPEGAPLPAF